MAAGLQKGDHVAIWLNNSDDWVFLMFGLLKAGAVLVPVNTRFRTADLEYVLQQSDSSMLITHDTCGPIGYLDMVRDVVALPDNGDTVADPNFPALRKVVVLDDREHAGTLAWDRAKNAAGSINAAALEQQAGGTTPGHRRSSRRRWCRCCRT